MHVNGLQNKFCEDDDSVIASAKAYVSALNKLVTRRGNDVRST